VQGGEQLYLLQSPVQQQCISTAQMPDGFGPELTTGNVVPCALQYCISCRLDSNQCTTCQSNYAWTGTQCEREIGINLQKTGQNTNDAVLVASVDLDLRNWSLSPAEVYSFLSSHLDLSSLSIAIESKADAASTIIMASSTRVILHLDLRSPTSLLAHISTTDNLPGEFYIIHISAGDPLTTTLSDGNSYVFTVAKTALEVQLPQPSSLTKNLAVWLGGSINSAPSFGVTASLLALDPTGNSKHPNP